VGIIKNSIKIYKNGLFGVHKNINDLFLLGFI